MAIEWNPHTRLDDSYELQRTFSFSATETKKLQESVGEAHPNLSDFIRRLESIVANSLAFQKHTEDCSVANVRGRLKKVKKAADRLKNELAGLDVLSRDLWGMESAMTASKAEDLTRSLCEAASHALSLAKQFSDSKKKNFPQRNLAFQVAGAFVMILGQEPTISHPTENSGGVRNESAYCKCLRIALVAAKISMPDDLYRLARKGQDSLSAVKNYPCDNSQFDVDGYD